MLPVANTRRLLLLAWLLCSPLSDPSFVVSLAAGAALDPASASATAEAAHIAGTLALRTLGKPECVFDALPCFGSPVDHSETKEETAKDLGSDGLGSSHYGWGVMVGSGYTSRASQSLLKLSHEGSIGVARAHALLLTALNFRAATAAPLAAKVSDEQSVDQKLFVSPALSLPLDVLSLRQLIAVANDLSALPKAESVSEFIVARFSRITVFRILNAIVRRLAEADLPLSKIQEAAGVGSDSSANGLAECVRELFLSAAYGSFKGPGSAVVQSLCTTALVDCFPTFFATSEQCTAYVTELLKRVAFSPGRPWSSPNTRSVGEGGGVVEEVERCLLRSQMPRMQKVSIVVDVVSKGQQRVIGACLFRRPFGWNSFRSSAWVAATSVKVLHSWSSC